MEGKRFLKRALHRYQIQILKRPIAAQVIAGWAISIFGDYLVQSYLDDKKSDYSKKRGLVVSSYASIEIALEAVFYYPFLDRVFGPEMTLINAFKKIAIDQSLYTPIETICFMFWTNKLEKRPEPIREKLNRDYKPTIYLNFVYWIPASVILYCYIPLQVRALFTSILTFSWDTFMSYAAHNNLNQRISNMIESK